MPEDATPESPRRARGRPKAWSDRTEQNTIKSLDRAMEVFEHLSTTAGATLSELAADTGQAPATAYRILVTLQARGLVEFDPGPQLWHIGPRAFLIGARYLRRTSLVERARPVLRHLMERTGETANLGIAREGDVLFVSQVETHASIRAFFPPGTLSPMHASGIGKAILANMPSERRAQLFRMGEPVRFTPRTLVAPDLLEADLAETRARGFAIDDEEKTEGMRCIAAPVFDLHGEVVAGISVSGPSARVTHAEIGRLAEAVCEAARALSAVLGARPDEG
ncbi:IclR family transcriptional regulator [Roseibacterium sp. SDUM158017]|uniref:HTH-type transcriptional regulator BhcR n=1 Tax=Roseicyclus salinarum TaxID=3036773 RepID=UPI00241550F7|nr:HTH-type transcriptional regulator BhcR [Roseibacterium sp. SDUM158017]MDG4648512.1 IclR family transcriptional regulator [Roseibacterium sp. SDUM158017]